MELDKCGDEAWTIQVKLNLIRKAVNGASRNNLKQLQDCHHHRRCVVYFTPCNEPCSDWPCDPYVSTHLDKVLLRRYWMFRKRKCKRSFRWAYSFFYDRIKIRKLIFFLLKSASISNCIDIKQYLKMTNND